MIVMRMCQITTSRPCSNKLYLCDPNNSLLEVRLRQFRGTVPCCSRLFLEPPYGNIHKNLLQSLFLVWMSEKLWLFYRLRDKYYKLWQIVEISQMRVWKIIAISAIRKLNIEKSDQLMTFLKCVSEKYYKLINVEI